MNPMLEIIFKDKQIKSTLKKEIIKVITSNDFKKELQNHLINGLVFEIKQSDFHDLIGEIWEDMIDKLSSELTKMFKIDIKKKQ